MADLAGFGVIIAFLAVAFGSMALCGVVGAAAMGLAPSVRARSTRTRDWALIGAIGGYVGAILVLVLWAVARSLASGIDGSQALPAVAWAGGFVGGAVARRALR